MSKARNTADQINRVNSSAADATAITIDSSENVLVGTTSSDDSTDGFKVKSSGQKLTITRNGAEPLVLNRRASDGDIVKFRKDNINVASIGTLGGVTYINSGDVGLSLDWGSDQIKPRQANGANRDAAIDLGASASRFKDLYLSSGVYLGGTGSANKLDDYEIGNFVPNQGSGLTVSGTFSSSGRYIKVGNLVTVFGNVNGSSSIAVSAVGIICTNLPFSIAEISTIGIATGAWTSSNSATFISLGATTTLYSAQAVSGATNIAFTHTYRV